MAAEVRSGGGLWQRADLWLGVCVCDDRMNTECRLHACEVIRCDVMCLLTRYSLARVQIRGCRGAPYNLPPGDKRGLPPQ